MPDIFLISLPFVAIWLLFVLFCSRSWQMPAAFIPFCIWGIYLGNNPLRWILLIPLLAILVLDIHIILKESKFSANVNILSYLLTIPFLVIYFYHDKGSTKETDLAAIIWRYISQVFILTLLLKFWFIDVLLLFINRFGIKEKHSFSTRIVEKSTRTVGRSTSYFVIFENLGKMEVSGFYYLSLKLKGIKPEDRLQIMIRKGCLGIEYMSGFPKALQ